MFYFAVPVDMDRCALGFAMDMMIHSDQIHNLHNGNCKQGQTALVSHKQIDGPQKNVLIGQHRGESCSEIFSAAD